MPDLAHLHLSISSGEAVTATRNLGALEKQAISTERATNNLTRSTSNLDQKFLALERDLERLEMDLAGTEAGMNRVGNAANTMGTKAQSGLFLATGGAKALGAALGGLTAYVAGANRSFEGLLVTIASGFLLGGPIVGGITAAAGAIGLLVSATNDSGKAADESKKKHDAFLDSVKEKAEKATEAIRKLEAEKTAQDFRSKGVPMTAEALLAGADLDALRAMRDQQATVAKYIQDSGQARVQYMRGARGADGSPGRLIEVGVEGPLAKEFRAARDVAKVLDDLIQKEEQRLKLLQETSSTLQQQKGVYKEVLDLGDYKRPNPGGRTVGEIVDADPIRGAVDQFDKDPTFFGGALRTGLQLSDDFGDWLSKEIKQEGENLWAKLLPPEDAKMAAADAAPHILAGLKEADRLAKLQASHESELEWARAVTDEMRDQVRLAEEIAEYRAEGASEQFIAEYLRAQQAQLIADAVQAFGTTVTHSLSAAIVDGIYNGLENGADIFRSFSMSITRDVLDNFLKNQVSALAQGAATAQGGLLGFLGNAAQTLFGNPAQSAALLQAGAAAAGAAMTSSATVASVTLTTAGVTLASSMVSGATAAAAILAAGGAAQGVAGIASSVIPSVGGPGVAGGLRSAMGPFVAAAGPGVIASPGCGPLG